MLRRTAHNPLGEGLKNLFAQLLRQLLQSRPQFPAPLQNFLVWKNDTWLLPTEAWSRCLHNKGVWKSANHSSTPGKLTVTYTWRAPCGAGWGCRGDCIRAQLLLCSAWRPLLLSQRCQSQVHALIQLLYTALHASVCFLGSPTLGNYILF